MTSDLITPFISTFTFVLAGCSSPALADPAVNAADCWGVLKLSKQFVARGELIYGIGLGHSDRKTAIVCLSFAKACKVSTLSDDTIKLPTSGEMQKVGKWGSYLSEAELTAHASMHGRVSCGDRWWKSWEDDLSFGITTAKHGDGDVTFRLCRLPRCG